MHEYSVASAIVDQVKGIIEEHNASKVKKIIVSASPYDVIIPELLIEAYGIITNDLEKFTDSALEIQVGKAEIKCLECDYSGIPDEKGDPEFAYNFLCPKCGSRDTHINMKNLTIESVDLVIPDN
ncbi:MAG: hydrogenase maturation nickel metallochaperone HypA [Candidatus Heimdallarchaeota archaeon]|nr:hydrogenase maturation nickel metallochaperone HypA [Candidatus Heimdallarchaeota archaeon]